jgi:E3 ubiquitin-protein ligase Topors
MDELDYQVERRVEIYKNELFVKASPSPSTSEQRRTDCLQHIGSNPITKFVPNPTPRQISEDPILTQRATSFLRRELRVWSLVDVEVLTSHILNLIKAIDIRSEPAVRLLSEWLDTDEYPRGAEQFAHELYSWLRSPYKDLRRYDEIAQVSASIPRVGLMIV